MIEEEPWRIEKLRRNVRLFIDGLKARGFDTLQSETAIVPIICGKDERTLMMTKLAQERGSSCCPCSPPPCRPERAASARR